METPKFEYEIVHPMLGQSYYKWEIVFENGYCIRGQANSVRQAYRNARRSLKRYRKMQRLLEET